MNNPKSKGDLEPILPGTPPHHDPPPYAVDPPVCFQYDPPTTSINIINNPTYESPRDPIMFQPVPTTTTVIIPQGDLGLDPARVRCQYCHADVTTRVRYETGAMTHICCLTIACFLCWPCACLPYVTDWSKDAVHICPNCNKYIGIHKR